MNTYNISLKFSNTYICRKLSIAITGQSAGVFCMCRRGCLNLSQSACKKFIAPLEEKESGKIDQNFLDCILIRLQVHKK